MAIGHFSFLDLAHSWNHAEIGFLEALTCNDEG